jgi:uncharacterized protein YdaU (DUF1376 family)
MSRKDFKPFWIKWDETAHLSDYAVLRMTPHQRLMYRNLIITSYYCSSRPYLPDDDEVLWLMADADTLEHWKANRQAIMVKFTQFVDSNGKRLLSNKRVLEEWEELEASLEQKKSAAAKSVAARRRRAATEEPLPAEAEPEREVEAEPELEVEVERSTPVERSLNERSESGGGVGDSEDALACRSRTPAPLLNQDGGNGDKMSLMEALDRQVSNEEIEKQVRHLLRSLYRLGGHTFDGKNRDALTDWLRRGFNPHEIEGAYRRFVPTLADRDLPYAPTRFCLGAGETIMVDVRIMAIRASCRFFHKVEVDEYDVEEYILPALPEEPLMYFKLLNALNLWLDEKLSLADFNREHQAALLPLTVEERRQYLKEHLATAFSLKPFLADAPVYARLAMDRAHAASVYEQAQNEWALYQPEALEESAAI